MLKPALRIVAKMQVLCVGLWIYQVLDLRVLVLVLVLDLLVPLSQRLILVLFMVLDNLVLCSQNLVLVLVLVLDLLVPFSQRLILVLFLVLDDFVLWSQSLVLVFILLVPCSVRLIMVVILLVLFPPPSGSLKPAPVIFPLVPFVRIIRQKPRWSLQLLWVSIRSLLQVVGVDFYGF